MQGSISRPPTLPMALHIQNGTKGKQQQCRPQQILSRPSRTFAKRTLLTCTTPSFMCFFLLVVQVLVNVLVVEGVAFRFVCSPQPEIVTLARNVETGDLVELELSPQGNGNGRRQRRRHLRGSIGPSSTNHDDRNDMLLKWEEPLWTLDEDTLSFPFGHSRGLNIVDDNDEQGSKSATGSSTIVNAMKCTCGPLYQEDDFQWHGEATVYCPTWTTHCGTYRNPEYHEHRIGCLTLPQNERLHNAVFLLLFIWAVVLVFHLCSSRRWLHCINYCISQCIPCYRRFLADRMLRRQPQLAQQYIRRNIRYRAQLLQQRLQQINHDGTEGNIQNSMQQQQHDEDQNKLPPTSLVLKTRIYRKDHPPIAKNNIHDCQCSNKSETDATTTASTESPKEDSNQGNAIEDADTDVVFHETADKSVVNADNDGSLELDDYDDLDDVFCIICFQNLHDGERVGALHCSHIFHVDCLKTWLQRRNACPMCNQNDVAEPRYNDPISSVGPAGRDESQTSIAEENTETRAQTDETVINNTEQR